MKMVSKNMSQYQVAGNPCAIEFTLDSDRITIKETGGCGSHRNIKCFFEGSFPKKRVVRAQMPAKKK